MKAQEQIVIRMLVAYGFVVFIAAVIANVYWMVIKGMSPETGSPVAEVMIMALFIAIPVLIPFILNGLFQYFGTQQWPQLARAALAVIVIGGGYHLMQGYTLDGKSSFWTTSWVWLAVAASTIVCVYLPFTTQGLLPKAPEEG